MDICLASSCDMDNARSLNERCNHLSLTRFAKSDYLWIHRIMFLKYYGAISPLSYPFLANTGILRKRPYEQ